MHTLFNPENPFWNFIGKITDVFCMSLLWLLTSLPIVTAGAATAAFYSFTLDQVKDQEGGVWNSFFRAFRRCFKRATCLWLMQLAAGAFLLLNLYAAWQFYVAKGLLGLGLLSLAICGALVYCMVSFYLCPITAAYDFPVKKILADSFVMAMGNLHVSITLMVVFLLAGVATYYLSGLFFFWFGLAVFGSSYFIWGLFLKYAGIQPEKRQKKKKKQPMDPYL